MSNNAILVINAGSSSIKIAIFEVDKEIKKLYSGMVDHINNSPELKIFDSLKNVVLSKNFLSTNYEQIVAELLESINSFLEHLTLKAVGHRVVHGGTKYIKPTLINDSVIDDLLKLIPLAPLHQPYNLKIITVIKKIYPSLPQVACFDTAFHSSQPKLAQLFAIPKRLSEAGVIRYGFHGLSYEYITNILPKYIPLSSAEGRVLVAHLGNGASACAIYKRKSIASSMGFTALEGLMMGTRCGTLDPGVILYLMEEEKLSVQQVIRLLYSESGLLGVSGISSDMRELEVSLDPNAQQAIELFCYKAAHELLALCTILKGIDVLVFTAGIGEHSYLVRQKICEWLNWLGISLNLEANKGCTTIISDKNSKVTVAVIPTNEELMIVEHTIALL